MATLNTVYRCVLPLPYRHVSDKDLGLQVHSLNSIQFNCFIYSTKSQHLISKYFKDAVQVKLIRIQFTVLQSLSNQITLIKFQMRSIYTRTILKSCPAKKANRLNQNFSLIKKIPVLSMYSAMVKKKQKTSFLQEKPLVEPDSGRATRLRKGDHPLWSAWGWEDRKGGTTNTMPPSQG